MARAAIAALEGILVAFTDLGEVGLGRVDGGEGVVNRGGVWFVDDAELCRLCDEGTCAVVAVELQSPAVELLEEFVGGYGLSWLDDFTDDVP